MHRRRLLWLAALPWAMPAAAAIMIDEAQLAGSDLVVAGQVTPPTRTVTLGVGPLASIILQPDAYGRFVWIGNQIPPGCTVSVSAGSERADAGVGRCGVGAPAHPVPAGTSSYGASGWALGTDPAPGVGVEHRTATRRAGPVIVSPNDPRYAQTEPAHWGQPDEQGWTSGELMYPYKGFYGVIRSKEAP